MIQNLLIRLAVALCSFTTAAQVGINTTTPHAQLDISIEDPASPKPTDGILIPRLDKFPATNPTSQQHGMMIFLTSQKGDFSPGFYWWNSSNTAWETLGGKSAVDFYKVGTTNLPETITDDVFRKGNVSIGGESKNVKLKVMIDAEENHNTRTAFEVENASATPKNVTYGIVSTNKTASIDKKYGIKNTVSAAGIGIHYGIFNEVSQNTNEEIYGIYNDVGKTFGSTKKHYGIYNEIGTKDGNGTVYGIYSTAIGNDPRKVYAGYFAGRVGIGTEDNDYVLPDTRGQAGQILVTDAAGIVTWQHPTFQNYNSTTSSTGSYIIGDDIYTLRLNNTVSGVTLPDAASNKGRILFIINGQTNSEKDVNFVNNDDLYDITTDTKLFVIEKGQKLMIQSAGNRWILLDK